MTDKDFSSTPFHRDEVENLEITVNSKPFHRKDREYSTGIEKLIQELECEGEGASSIHNRSTGTEKIIPPECTDLSTGKVNGLGEFIFEVKVINRRRGNREYIEKRIYLPRDFNSNKVLVLPLNLALRFLRESNTNPPEGESVSLTRILKDLTLNLEVDEEARLKKIIEAYNLDVKGLIKLAIELLARNYTVCPECGRLAHRVHGVLGRLFYCRRCSKAIVGG